jgi:hypothetical protein
MKLLFNDGLPWSEDIQGVPGVRFNTSECTTWFKYDRDNLCVNKSQFVPVIFEPPCNSRVNSESEMLRKHGSDSQRFSG